MKRAILYARVSTDDQADKGYSLPSQFEAMRKYAAQQGFEVVAEFQDDYSGATPIEYRPEGGKAYAMLKSGAADVIIAYTIDRFVRPPEDGDEWDMPVLIRGLAKLGKEIHTVKRGKLNTNFADLLIALLDARKAGEERRDIRERVMRGKQAKAKSGRVVGCKSPPYGYRYVRDQHGKITNLEIYQPEARIVRMIYKWYVNEGVPNQTIAAKLSDMKILCPKLKRSVWSPSTVKVILQSETYKGIWRYGRMDSTTNRRRPIEETIEVTVPAIVEAATWERAQARSVYNKEHAKRNTKRNYLLSMRITCGVCNSLYVGLSRLPTPNRKGQRYYRDSLRRGFPRRLRESCGNGYVNADAIEADVWDEIKDLFHNPDALWENLKAAQSEEERGQVGIHDKLQSVEEFIEIAEREADQTARALKKAEEGGAVYKSLKRDETEINARIVDLHQQREKYLAQLKDRKLTDEIIESIMDYARDVRAGIDSATLEDKRRMLETLDVQVTVTHGTYHIKCVLGEKDGVVSTITQKGVRIANTMF